MSAWAPMSPGGRIARKWTSRSSGDAPARSGSRSMTRSAQFSSGPTLSPSRHRFRNAIRMPTKSFFPRSPCRSTRRSRRPSKKSGPRCAMTRECLRLCRRLWESKRCRKEKEVHSGIHLQPDLCEIRLPEPEPFCCTVSREAAKQKFICRQLRTPCRRERAPLFSSRRFR